jgi:formylglycine-generating enzyme required for sulfatase activity
MKYVLIPPGEFSLPPEYTTLITKPYYMAVAEVPVGHFKFFASNRSYITEAEQPGLGGTVPIKHVPSKSDEKYSWQNSGYETSTNQHPVTQVSWNDAKAYCEFLSATSTHTFRLSTEAEWIWAAATGNGNIEFRDQDDPQKLGWHAKNSNQPQSIQQIQPNAFSLFDTFGNVREWCHDYYGDYPQAVRKLPRPGDTVERVAHDAGHGLFQRDDTAMETLAE